MTTIANYLEKHIKREWSELRSMLKAGWKHKVSKEQQLKLTFIDTYIKAVSHEDNPDQANFLNFLRAADDVGLTVTLDLYIDSERPPIKIVADSNSFWYFEMNDLIRNLDAQYAIARRRSIEPSSCWRWFVLAGYESSIGDLYRSVHACGLGIHVSLGASEANSDAHMKAS
jgi:hypothetical protein